jgi:serine/threonine protein kinase
MDREMKLKISVELARAVHELSHANILHCDIKPANTVLHTAAHGRPQVKLIDFGEACDVITPHHPRAAPPRIMQHHITPCTWRHPPTSHHARGVIPSHHTMLVASSPHHATPHRTMHVASSPHITPCTWRHPVIE